MTILSTFSKQSRDVRRRGGWRRGLVALAAVLPVVSVLAVASPASAHANVVTGVASCQVDGTYTVTWTVANDFASPVATTLSSTTGGGTVTGLPVTIGVSPAKATVTQAGVAGSTKSASLTVTGVWGDRFTTTNTGSVRLDGKCAPQHLPITLCHATDSNRNPYVPVTVDDDAVVKEGHGSHTGPIWNPTLKANHVTWGDIIPAFPYYDDHGTLKQFAGLNTPAGNAVLAADCTFRIAIPAKPVPTPPTCSADGSLTLVDGEHYTWSDTKQPGFVGTHTVTATAAEGYVFTNGRTTVSYTVVVEGATNDCAVRLVAPTVTQPVCTGPGTSSVGQITLPADTAEVTYTVNGTVVTATTHTPNRFSATTGWVVAGNGLTATYSVSFTSAGDCLVEVVPVAPQVVQSVCSGPGTATVPTVTPATTVGITYSVNVNVVTATPDHGYVLADTKGWTIDAETGVGSYTVTLVTPDCTVVVTVVEPTITTSEQCGVASTFTVPETAGITYLVDGEPIDAGTYSSPTTGTVTAQAQQGYALSSSEWSFTLDLPATVPCPTVVTPVDPVTDPSGECGVEGTYVIASTEGIDYLLDGVVVAAGRYDGPVSGTVTARAQEGFTLADTAWSYALDLPAAETCSLPNTGGKLPQTGAETGGIVGFGAVALLAGLVLVVIGRRRQGELG